MAFITGTAVAVASFSSFMLLLSLLPPYSPDDKEFRGYAVIGLMASISVLLGVATVQ